MSVKPRKIVTATVASSVRNSGANREQRRRLLSWARRNKERDPVARAAHEAMTAKDSDAEIVAAISLSEKRAYVERLGLLLPLEGASSCVEIPSLPASEERADASARLLNIESADRARNYFGSAFEGLYVAFFETGVRAIDAETRRLLGIFKEDGYRIGRPQPSIMDEIVAQAATHVRARHSWRSDMLVAYAPPEVVADVAAERLDVEAWLCELETAYEGDRNAVIRHILHATADMGAAAGARAAVAYASLMRAIAERVKSVTGAVGPDGVKITVELGRPEPHAAPAANDNGLDNDGDRYGVRPAS